jgi:TRAP-type mannitol/chloroaromatic compound transport system permease large subunit
MSAAGLCMLALVAIVMIATGLPAFVVLIGVSVLFAIVGVALGVLPYELLTALPWRVLGLLESDLLQALPLYVLMGALLNRLPLADTLFRAGNALFARTPAAPLLAALGLGALLAPMNGSVGAGVATLSRVVHPRLVARGVPGEQSLAVVCVASTLGVVVPPSLVLILLGDAMLGAHTQAVTQMGRLERVINTQDVFRGALAPAALFLLLCFGWVWWTGRRARPAGVERVGAPGWLAAGAAVVLILGLLSAVTAGYLYAVEAAAAGAVALFAAGLATRALTFPVLALVLRNTMAVTGALFALFIAATTFTLVFRAFGSDRLLETLVQAIPGGGAGAAAAVLLVLGLCAFVLDAFEIILVVIPLLMPALLMREPDAVWVSVLALLALQASFLIPPFGYAVMMARSATAETGSLRRLTAGLLPFLGLQLLVLGATLAWPPLVHLAEPAAVPTRPLSPAEIDRQLDIVVPAPEPEDER